MKRFSALVAAALAAALVLSGCAGGPTSEEVTEWNKFASMRRAEHEAFDTYDVPVSVKEYVIGAPAGVAYDGPDGVYAGRFLGAVEAPGPDLTAHIYGSFQVEAQVVGAERDVIVIDMGPVPERDVDIDAAVRGAGTVVVFLTRGNNIYTLVDGSFSIATTDGDGRLSMPLVEKSAQKSYLTGVSDVADIAALAIAGRLDSGDILDDLGNGGVSGSEQDLIDKANDLAGNG